MGWSPSRSLPTPLLSYLVVQLAAVTAVADPIAATWSTETFGPDGPWQAVEVGVGSEQTISMYPGAEWMTRVLPSDYCDYNRSLPCNAMRAGLYNKEQSELGGSGSSALIQWEPEANYMYGLSVSGEGLTMWVDDMDLGGETVSNVSMALIGENFAVYPDASQVPLSVGCLGVGAPDNINQTFSNSYGPAVNASLIPGYLWSQGTITSNSFGMHIGSAANARIEGSLYFGGYDRNRIVGDIITGKDSSHGPVTLKDISIDVVDGVSPWQFDKTLGGLLAEGNSSIASAGLDIAIDGCSPYLTLPQSTCDAIASHLPVEYDEGLGLYIWQTGSAKYGQIASSASALRFTFLSGSNTRNASISVPFPHLNLTLGEPLVATGEESKQYFPCFTGSSSYTLGRAFLQDAFIGANWGAETWWLAQAPGPNIPGPDVVELSEDDTEVEPSANDWKESWSGSWRVLSQEDVSATDTSNEPAPQSTQGNDNEENDNDEGESEGNVQREGLASGAKAGIGVGVGVVGLALIVAIGLLLMKSRKKSRTTASQALGSSDLEVSSAPPAAMGGAAPQHGWYQPVKPDATSPGLPGMAYTDNNMYAQSYYPQELTADNTPRMELPGSNPEPHLLGVHATAQQHVANSTAAEAGDGSQPGGSASTSYGNTMSSTHAYYSSER